MESLFIRDFRLGLDTRRSELTQRPGTLEVLTNGFINQGGEIENRKAFVRTAQIANSFGLQATANGLYTFGSASTPGGYPLNIGTVGKPIYVNYQQLKHPQDLFDGTTNVVAMTEVVHSSQYRGKAWVIAKFGTSGTFGYYDGTLVYEFIDGQVMSFHNTNAKIAQAIEQMIDRTGVYSASTVDNVVTVTGDVGQVYTISSSETTVGNGVLSLLKTGEPISPTTGSKAVGGFEIISGSQQVGVNQITKVEVHEVIQTAPSQRARTTNVVTLTVPSGHGITTSHFVDVRGISNGANTYEVTGAAVTATTATSISYACTGADEVTTSVTEGKIRAFIPITITAAAVNWTTSNEETARLVAVSINSATSSPDYTASVNGSKVEIRAANETATVNAFDVRITVIGNVCICDSRFQISISTGFTLDSVSINGQSVVSSPLATSSYATAYAFTSAIATAINAVTSTYGYVANAVGSVLYVSKQVTSAYEEPISIFFNLSGASTSGNGIYLASRDAVAPLVVEAYITGQSTRLIRGLLGVVYYEHSWFVTITARGGLTPYSYVWQNGVTATQVGPTHFQLVRYTYSGTPPALNTYCVVTDAGGNLVNSNQL